MFSQGSTVQTLAYKTLWDQEISELHVNILGASNMSDLQNRRLNMDSDINSQEKATAISAKADRSRYLLRQPISPATKQTKKTKQNPSASFRICPVSLIQPSLMLILRSKRTLQSPCSPHRRHSTKQPEESYHRRAL